MWRSKSGKGGHKTDAAAVFNLRCKRFDIRSALDDLQFIPQPLHHSAGDEYTAFEGVTDVISLLPRCRGEQFVI